MIYLNKTSCDNKTKCKKVWSFFQSNTPLQTAATATQGIHLSAAFLISSVRWTKNHCFENSRTSAGCYFMSEVMHKWSTCSKVSADHAVKEQHFQRQFHTPDTTLRPGVLGRELTSLTSVSSDVLPSPEQLSSSWSLSSCFKSGASTRGRQWRVERERGYHYSMPCSLNIHKQKEGGCWFNVSSFKVTQPLQQEFSYILWYRRQDSAQTAMLCLHRHAKECLLF